MKWYKFRQTQDFKRANIVVPISENGKEIECTSDQLQRKEVVSWRWVERSSGFDILEVTIKE